MSVRMFLALAVLLAVACSLGALAYTTHLVESNILALFPADASDGAAKGLHLLLTEQMIGVGIVDLIVALLAFLFVGNTIARPLRAIVKSMDAFATTGEHLPIPNIDMAPSEINSLAKVFINFSARVEKSHERDVEISRVKSDFISTAAHQLRTPLTGIRWALEALQKEPGTESQKALIQNAVDKSHDLVSVVGTLLDISSIESGKFKYVFEPVNITTLVEGVARDFEPLATEHKVSLIFTKDEEQIPDVRADHERIKWVLNNLVENAIRYTPAGGAVRITMEQVPGRVYVNVRDTGIGIQTKDRSNIFERFYRAGNAITKENKGNGLGLYIARTIATDHGGDLNFVPNEDGPGTTFTLSLPITAIPG